MFAGSGTDYVDGGQGNDVLYGEGGDDDLYGRENDDVLAGDNLAVALSLHGSDLLDGGAGNDSLNGQGGMDTLYGGVGDDTLNGDDENILLTLAYHGADLLYGEDGKDLMVGGSGNDSLFGGTGNDTLIGEGSAAMKPEGDTLPGNDFLDAGAGDDYLDGERGNDTILGGDGQDTLFGWTGDDILSGDAGDDFLSGEGGMDALGGGDGNDVVAGGDGDDSLGGGSGTDVLSGGSGGDELSGGADADRLFGGADNDTLDGGEGSDLIYADEGDDYLQGGADNDELQGADGADTLAGGGGDDLLAGLDGDDSLDGGAGNDEVQGGEGFDTLYGGEGDDRLYGLADDDVLDGGAGADEVQGNDGNDVVAGGAGNDLLYGQNGNDTLDGGAGDDALSGDGGVDTYVFGRGYGNDTIYANDGTLSGYTGNDVLRFNADLNPEDVLASRKGNNLVLTIDGTADTLTIADYYVWTARTPTYYDYTYYYGSRPSVVKFADNTTWAGGSVPMHYAGSSGNDQFEGTSAAESFAGTSGSDTIYGGGGSDTFRWGVGSGKDVVYGSSGGMVVIDSSAAPTDLFMQRVGDQNVIGINGSPDQLIASGLSRFKLERDGLTWTYSDLFLVPTDAADGLYGTTGSDRIEGAAGNDTILGGGGIDTLLGGSGADSITINGSSGGMVDGGDGDDSLTNSGGGAATLVGGTGNDTLRSVTGYVTDTLVGGGGDDVYVIENTNTVITELANEGVDSVFCARSYTLSDNIENLTLSANNSGTGTGNGLNNMLVGSTYGNTLVGAAGEDTLDGGAGNDSLDGGADSDTYFFGRGAGQDTIAGETAGNGTLDTVLMASDIRPTDVLLARNGNDLVLSVFGTTDSLRISGYFVNSTGVELIRFQADGTTWDAPGIEARMPNDADNVLMGTSSNDWIGGFGGNDVMYGSAGNDTLDGAIGNDTLVGGTGSDFYYVDSAFDVLMENPGEGYDSVQSSVTYTLPDNVDSLTLTGNGALSGTGNSGDNTLRGNIGSNLLYGGAGNDTLDASLVGAGADTLVGGTGDDWYTIDTDGTMIAENPGEGTDTVVSYITHSLAANVENLTLAGSGGYNATGNGLDNVLTGNDAGNLLSGGAGNDTLNGAGGVDTLVGGAGNDTYVYVADGDVFTENAGEGTDTIQSYVSYALGANFENLSLAGWNLSGTGNAANNLLAGYDGNDTLDGGAGADTLQGGRGDDTYLVDNANDVIVENLNDGVDSVQSTVTCTLAGNVDNLTLMGGNAINGTGNSGNNVLTGNSANNVLTGGAGNDTYFLTSGDTVVENLNEGIDTVQIGATYTLASNVDNVVLTGTSRINATGNDLANVLTGNIANNALSGGKGDDTLIGGGGTDSLIGGEGNDYYVIDDSRDTITEASGGGTDTVQSSFTYALGTTLENLVLAAGFQINGTGNVGNNVITGNEMNNALNGGAGADTLKGGAGNDTYTVDSAGDVIVENAGEGTDLVQSSVTHTLPANVENLTLTGTAAINGIGNSLNNTLTGNSAVNVLTGGGGDDLYIVTAGDQIIENAGEGIDTARSAVTFTLAVNVENLILTGTAAAEGRGNDLDNVLTGNSANNKLTGGRGNDTYIVASGDTVVELADEGIDTAQSAATFTLGANVENLTLTGSSSINGTGNGLNNILIGNDGANQLTGGGGDDTYFIGAGDRVVEGDGQGFDTVYSSVAATLDTYVEKLILTGAGAVAGTGNDRDNVIIGNGANNVLDGRGGNDQLMGGLGDDTYILDSAGDAAVENAGEGNDTVKASFNFVSDGSIENVTLTGTASINAAGDDGNNALTGNSAANALSGGAGNDTLAGGGGADTLYGGLGDDTYLMTAGAVVVENGGEGTDTMTIDLTSTLPENVENLTLTGTTAINGTGNSSNNSLTGNGASNVLDGAAGADHLYGGAGNDTLFGQAYDTLEGGAGDDLYDVTGTNAVAFGEPGPTGAVSIYESAGAGLDTVQSDVSVTLYQYMSWYGNAYHWYGTVENATLKGSANISASGNDLNNVLIGNEGDNYLFGYLGDDRLEGGAGNDSLHGGAGVNTLMGGIGNDTLGDQTDLNGTDHSYGGAGDDIYYVNAGDTVTEYAGEGVDTVYAYGNYTLPGYVENLRVEPGFSGTGNVLDNLISARSYGGLNSDILSGMAGDDTLDGGDGADSLTGGTGNDTYVVDHVGDVVSENLNEGTDTVKSAVNFSLASYAHVENVTLTGNSSISATGNAGANILTGNGGSNILTGGAGDDTYVIDSLDTVVENAGEGNDTVHVSNNYTLAVTNVENVTLTGTGNLNGTGNGGSNILTGNAGNNVLDGAGGIDTLKGGAGDDTYVVDDSSESVQELQDQGIDLVKSSASYLDCVKENPIPTVTRPSGLGREAKWTFCLNSVSTLSTCAARWVMLTGTQA